MDELYFDNKKYITTKKAAALANYAKDYVGQLARSGKIDARLIGRNWYISEEALIEHAFGKKAEQEGSDKQPIVEESQFATGGDDSFESAQGTVDPEDMSTGESQNAEVQSHPGEPIQNYGLETILHTDQALYDEIASGIQNLHESSGVKYWSDDTALYPQLPDVNEVSKEEYAHSQAADAPQVSSEKHHEHSDTSDVSKITLTLRSRLINQEIQRTQAPNALQRPFLGQRRSEGYDEVYEDAEQLSTDHPRRTLNPSLVLWIVGVLSILLLAGLFSYAFSSSELKYERQETV